MLQKILEEVGLHPQEASVYLCSIRMGTQDIKTLSKETKLTPIDVSVTLANLLDKGFVSKFSRGKDFFTPEKPGVLVKMLENSHLKKNREHREIQKTPSQV